MNNFKFVSILSLTSIASYFLYKIYENNKERSDYKLKNINLYEDKIKLKNKLNEEKIKLQNLTDENKIYKSTIIKLIEEKEHLKSIVDNLTIEIKCYKNQCDILIEENNLNINKINQTDILFYDELIDECYDNIPCSNIKKLIK